MYRMIITLKSDLCAGNGDSFATAIDTDVCADRYGIPVIPARRLKGVLRESAQLIGTPDGIIDGIFGVPGSNTTGSLRISDAHPLDYERLIESTKGQPAQKILSFFTTVRASTAIENDTAKDNSLRFTRVVCRYFNGKELQFSSDIDIGEEYAAEFSDICRGVRNIGLKRTRGFGAVRCELTKAEEARKTIMPEITDNEEEVTLEFAIKTLSDLVLSDDYIRGSAIIGALASEYLKTREADSYFEELFLRDYVKFSNLYITDNPEKLLHPVPMILGKIKGISGAVKMTDSISEDSMRPKPIKSGYTSFDMKIVNTPTGIVYHHSTKDRENGLYTQKAIGEGILFSGSITGKGKYIKTISELMSSGRLNIGKSKTAQYSQCQIEYAKAYKIQPSKLHIRKGELYVAVMVSDILLSDGAGSYSLDIEDFVKAVGVADKYDPNLSVFGYKNIGGYSSVRNLQCTQIRSVTGGSIIVFKAAEDRELPTVIYIGERQSEGYGKVIMCKIDDYHKEVETAHHNTEPVNTIIFSEAERRKKLLQAAFDYLDENKMDYMDKKEVNGSQIGRIILMAKESATWVELANRVKSIRSKKTREAFEKIVKLSNIDRFRNDNEWREYIINVLTLIKYRKRGVSK